MSHTNSTAHYGLPQFVSADKPTYLGDSNSAYLAIDNGINAAQAKADGADAKATENAGKITQLQADLTQTNQQVSTVQQIANNANSTAISANDLANAMAKEGAIDTANLANKAVTSEKIDFATLETLADSYTAFNLGDVKVIAGKAIISQNIVFTTNGGIAISPDLFINLPEGFSDKNFTVMLSAGEPETGYYSAMVYGVTPSANNQIKCILSRPYAITIPQVKLNFIAIGKA